MQNNYVLLCNSSFMLGRLNEAGRMFKKYKTILTMFQEYNMHETT